MQGKYFVSLLICTIPLFDTYWFEIFTSGQRSDQLDWRHLFDQGNPLNIKQYLKHS